MKTNEALEKIYLDEDESWHLTNPNGDSVEYTRTDAFIEKACEWLKNNSHNYANNALGKEYLVNDFVNYMKGE